MKNKLKYDPEDIESLMLNKTFDELLDVEKNFVLRHLDSEKEYNSMRKTLLNIKTAFKEDDFLIPSPAIQSKLIADFESKNQPKQLWYHNLNQIFTITPVYRNPVFQVSIAAMFLLVSFFILKNVLIKPPQNIASTEIVTEDQAEDNQVISDSVDQVVIEERIEKEDAEEPEKLDIPEPKTKEKTNPKSSFDEKPDNDKNYGIAYEDNKSKTTDAETNSKVSSKSLFDSYGIAPKHENATYNRSLKKDEDLIELLYTAL